MAKKIMSFFKISNWTKKTKIIFSASLASAASISAVATTYILLTRNPTAQEPQQKTNKQQKQQKESEKFIPSKEYEEKYISDKENNTEVNTNSQNVKLENLQSNQHIFHPVVKYESRIKNFNDLTIEDFAISQEIKNLYDLQISDNPGEFETKEIILEMTNKETGLISANTIERNDVWNLLSENYLNTLDQGISENGEVQFEKIKFSEKEINSDIFKNFTDRFNYKFSENEEEISIIIGENQFKDKTINGNLNFKNTVINENAFINSTIKGDVFIEKSQVKKKAFEKAKIQGTLDIIENSTMEQDSFKTVTIEEDVHLEDATIKHHAFGHKSEFKKDLIILNSKFEDDLNFVRVIINGDLKIENSSLPKEAFLEVNVKGSLTIDNLNKNNTDLQFKQDSFKNSEIEGDVQLKNVDVGLYAFGESTFNGNINISNSILRKEAFKDATTKGNINIGDSTIGEASFKGKEATSGWFSSTPAKPSKIFGSVSIKNSSIEKEAFQLTEIKGSLKIEDSNIEQDSFKTSVIEGDVQLNFQLHDNNLHEHAFLEATINKSFIVKGSSYTADQIVSESKIKGNPSTEKDLVEDSNN